MDYLSDFFKSHQFKVACDVTSRLRNECQVQSFIIYRVLSKITIDRVISRIVHDSIVNFSRSRHSISESRFFRVRVHVRVHEKNCVRVHVHVQLFRRGPINHKSRKNERRSWTPITRSRSQKLITHDFFLISYNSNASGLKSFNNSILMF